MKTLLLLSLMAAAGVGAAPTTGTPGDAATSRPARQAPSSPAAKSTKPSQQSSFVANVRKAMALMNRTADELEGVRDKASADAAADQVRRSTAQLESLSEASQSMSLGMPEKERSAAYAAVGEEYEKSTARLERVAKDLAAKGCYGSEKLDAALEELIGGEDPAAEGGDPLAEMPAKLRPLATNFIEDEAQRREMTKALESVSDRAGADAVAPAIVEQANQLHARLLKSRSLFREASLTQEEVLPYLLPLDETNAQATRELFAQIKRLEKLDFYGSAALGQALEHLERCLMP